MLYAGIGSRNTPQNVCEVMTSIAQQLGVGGWKLRSGHAGGADLAFEVGAMSSHSEMEIFLPWAGFNGAPRTKEYKVPDFTGRIIDIAAAFHPRWHLLSQGAQKLHARNVCQILGGNFEEPVDLVICWTKDGLKGGGTGQAVRIANAHGIPVFDLALQSDCIALMNHVNK